MSRLTDGSRGRYTRQDYAWCQVHPTETNCGNGAGEIGDLGWEGVGSYIARITSENNQDIISPAPPSGVGVQ